jgi:hypothetical protein
MPSPPVTRSRAGRFFRSPDTGQLVVVQLPNAPLWGFLAATVLRLLLTPHGTVGSVLRVVGTASLVVWAVLEIAHGESPFRRVLGVAVLAFVVVGLLTRQG